MFLSVSEYVYICSTTIVNRRAVMFMEATKSKEERKANRRLKAGELAEKVGLNKAAENLKMRAAERYYKAGNYDAAAEIYFKSGTKNAQGFANRLIDSAEGELSHKDFEQAIKKVEAAVDIYGRLYKQGAISGGSMASFCDYLSYVYSKRADTTFEKGAMSFALKEYEKARDVVPEVVKKYGVKSYGYNYEPWMPKMHFDYYAHGGHIEGRIADVYDFESKHTISEAQQIDYLRKAMESRYGTDFTGHWHEEVTRLTKLTSEMDVKSFLDRLERKRSQSRRPFS